ncbi:MAG: hypothetical protein L3J09_09385 [Flavobacteriaceae bacterium]|nr:hypothetical protein [Flavobacteriaceae bacterium]
MIKYILSVFVVVLIISCKSETKKTVQKVTEVKEISIVQELSSPSTANSSLPRLFSNGEKIFMSWVTKSDTVSTLKYASFNKNKWSDAIEITSGKDWFVNWADFPVIAENNGNILTSLLQKSAKGTYTYDVKLNLFSKEKNQWKNNFLLNLDGKQSEHGFVSMLPSGENSFFVTWLDGRTLVDMPKGKEQMTLRGAIITQEGEITNDILLDDRTCECCNTAATMTENGSIVVYRNRSEKEIRDIAIVRFENGKWTAPQIVIEDNWHIPGCPVNGPAIVALGPNVALAWFTAANDNAKVQIAFSEDNGATFGLPVRIDNGNAMGRVDLVMLDANNAVVSWMEPSGLDTVIRIVKVSSDGTQGKPLTITKTRSERSSGFPQMEVLDDKIYIAWTSLEEEKPSIKFVSVLKNSL